ncbi:WD40-repeat-containing domain protein [Globomyces pollinis-pini]|nr:WD40-repeat-containing domain protein [Globomyces pollinis-pini]
MSITSDEINYLIYRYLVESGFNHTSFAFQYETAIHTLDIKGKNLKPGKLIQLLQKGLLFSQVESHINDDGSEKKCIAPYHVLEEHTCQIKEKKKKRKKENKELTSESVKVLDGHRSEVFVCDWNMHHPLLASGSGDGFARIWSVPNDLTEDVPFVELAHGNGPDSSRDVTTVCWSPNGNYLATGSYDGLARIWSKTGELKNTLEKHNGPIFNVKWNKTGDLLASVGVDKSAIVWDVRTGDARQQFNFHTGATLDIDWKDDTTFATSSADRDIYVCQLGSLEPLKQFAGHRDEINCIRWSPNGQLLASCSDDHTAKIWDMNEDSPLFDFTKHEKEIYTTSWCPPDKSDPQKLWLATASFDGSVRIWDINNGDCIYVLQEHSQAVYTVAFSPDCQFVASGSFDKSVIIYSLKDGSMVQKYGGDGGVFEVAYNATGNKLAACYSDTKVVIIRTD